MLSSEEQELLTAYVDGELSGPKRRLVARLLRRSAEARTLLRDLQGDSRELRAMPTLRAPVDLSSRILRRIEAAPRPVLRVPRRAAPVRFPLYRGLAAAAAVLLLVGLGSFFLHPTDRPAANTHDGVENRAHQDPAENKVEPATNGVARQAEQPEEKAPVAVVRHPKPPETPKLPAEDEEEKPVVVVTPDPDRPDGPILTAPGRESRGVLERVELALPTFHRLHTLDRPRTRAKSHRRTDRPGLPRRAYRQGCDARLRPNPTGLRRPQDQSRLRPGRRRPNQEAAMANRLRPLPREHHPLGTGRDPGAAVGAADRLGADKKPSEMRFDGSLIVKELSAWDRLEVADLLGVDPVKNRPAAPGTSLHRLQSAPRRADRRPGGRQPRGQGAAPPRLVRREPRGVCRDAVGPRDRSLDLRSSSSRRGCRPRPGTLQVFLVLRNRLAVSARSNEGEKVGPAKSLARGWTAGRG